MGNDVSSLKDYHIGQPYISNAESPVKVAIAPASSILDGQKYTTFQYPKERGTADEAAEKNIEIIRTTRHPFILKYFYTFDESKQIVLVTEHVTPLDVAVEKQESMEVLSGLYNVLEALIFLHEKSLICHNSICVSSVFVTDDGTWKLAAFENSSKIQRISKQSYENDITGYAEFALSVLEYLKDDAQTTIEFMQRLENEFLGENKEIPGSVHVLLNDEIFKFPFLEVAQNLKTLTLKSVEEKKIFYKTLDTTLRSIPSLITCRRIISTLFSHFIVTDSIADEYFLKYLFASGNEHCKSNNVKPIVESEHFKKFCMPLIVSMYESRDLAVRMTIMKYLPLYIDCLDKEILKMQILPEILLGLKDNNDALVTATFGALAHLVRALGSEVVVGGERRTCFFDRKPDFTRSPGQNVRVKSYENVHDVIKNEVKSLPRSKDPNQITDEKKQRRLEREQQREEQRKKREKRRQEREAAKFHKLQTQSSEECNDIDATQKLEKNLRIPVTSSTESREEQPLEDESDARNYGNNSEPDWEGFEAFSNGSESETKDWNERRKSSTLSIEHDDWGWDNDLTSDKGKIESSNVMLVGDKASLKNEVLSKEQKRFNAKQDISEEKKAVKSKALSLTSMKKVKPNTENDSTKKNQLNKNKVNGLGNEFDIKINTEIVAEPDYFADMIPSIEKNSKTNIVIEKEISTISSKFDAMDANQQEADGWDDDVWGNDEEMF